VERRRRVEEAGISLAPDCPFRSLVPGTVEPGFGGARTRRNGNRAAQQFRLMAQAVSRADTALDAFYRRMRSRLGPAQAVTAHKRAKIFFRMLRHGEAYVGQGEAAYTARHREQQLQQLKRKAQRMDCQLIQTERLSAAITSVLHGETSEELGELVKELQLSLG